MLDTVNLVTYSELFQLLAIFSGAWLAILSIAVSVVVAWYIRDSNRRDKDNDRRHKEAEETNDRRHKEAEETNERRHREAEEANERRHQELLKAIGLLYHHVHADGSPAIVPLPDIEPVAPTPADD